VDTESLIARSGERLEENLDFVRLDVPRVLTRLLLFESYILECSLRLRDVIALVRAVGVEGAHLLLETGGLQLSIDTTNIAYPTPGTAIVGYDPLSFEFVRVMAAEREQNLKSCLWELEGISGVKRRKLSKLSENARQAIVWPSGGADFGQAALEAFVHGLEQSGALLQVATQMELERRGIAFPADFGISVERRDAGACVVDTDLGDLGIPSGTTLREIIGHALLALGGLELRFEKMQAFGSITAFNDDDFSLMERKLRLIVEEAGIGERAREDQLRRVVRLAHLPSLEDVDLASIDFGKFVELRDSEEMREFRHWLTHAATASDKELEDRIKNIRARVAAVLGGHASKAVRLAFTSGVGMIPEIGPAAGLLAGALDSFALDKLVGEPGPLAFFVRRYRSMFDGA
jgi:hypothetical protein